MDEKRREHRLALDIPVHDDPREHTFVDGFCTCGEPDPDRPRRTEGPNRRNRRHLPGLDVQEGNWEEYR